MVSQTPQEMLAGSIRLSQDPDSNAAYEESLVKTYYWNQMNENKKLVCKEYFMTRPEVIYTKKDFFLLDEINEKIHYFAASGLINHWSFQSINKIKLRVRETNQPQVCTWIIFRDVLEF